MVGNPLSTGATSEMKKLDSPHFERDSSRIAKNSRSDAITKLIYQTLEWTSDLGLICTFQ